MIARIFVFVEIPHQIRCGISTIMGRAAGLSRQSGQNGHVRTAAEAGAPEPDGGERLSKRHCPIAPYGGLAKTARPCAVAGVRALWLLLAGTAKTAVPCCGLG